MTVCVLPVHMPQKVLRGAHRVLQVLPTTTLIHPRSAPYVLRATYPQLQARLALPVPLAPPTQIKMQQRNAPRAMQGNTRHLQPHHARHAQLGKLTQTAIHQQLARRAVLASMLQQVALTAPHVTRVQPIWMLPLQLHVLLATAVSTRLSRLRHAHHVPWEPLMLTQTRQHHVSCAMPGRTLPRQLQPASHVRLAKLTQTATPQQRV